MLALEIQGSFTMVIDPFVQPSIRPLEDQPTYPEMQARGEVSHNSILADQFLLL